MNLIERAAYDWGRVIASYGRYVVKTGQVKIEGLENLPDQGTIWYSWHDSNLVGLALRSAITPHPIQSFVPPGIVGSSMSGWLQEAGFIPLTLPKDGTGNPSMALKAMMRGLEKDQDVIIALDGPHGPVRKARPGTFWLGKMTGRPLIALGFAAQPSFRYPRWDRHVVPLPKAKFAIVLGKPMYISREQEIDDALLESFRIHLNSIVNRAWEIL